MVQENFVSFEIAKLLKEKGFNWACLYYWQEEISEFCIPKGIYKWSNGEIPNMEIASPYRFSAPPLQMAMKWLREVHYITIDVFHFRNWKVNIKTIPDDYFKADYSYPELKPAETYEQACEAAIKYCIKHLI